MARPVQSRNETHPAPSIICLFLFPSTGSTNPSIPEDSGLVILGWSPQRHCCILCIFPLERSWVSRGKEAVPLGQILTFGSKIFPSGPLREHKLPLLEGDEINIWVEGMVLQKNGEI